MKKVTLIMALAVGAGLVAWFPVLHKARKQT